MAKAKVVQSSGPTRDYNDLLALLKPKNLDTVFLAFKKLTNAPDDLKCLLIVAANLHHTFKKLRSWRTIGPFKGWPLLMLYICIHARKIQQQFGEIVNPPVLPNDRTVDRWVAKIFRGELDECPLYAMLCCRHSELRVRYGALQLQMLYARSEETLKAKTSFLQRQRRGKLASGTRIGRIPERYARAARDLSGPYFTDLLSYLWTEQLPSAFVKNPGIGDFPSRRDYPDRFRRIMNYCGRHRGAREGQTYSGASRGPRQPSYPDYVGYTEFRYGIDLESESGEDEQRVNQQAIEERSISEELALELGLDPRELGLGSVDILSEVPGAAGAEEALQTARARTRSWEIDKSQFAWNAQALRIAELETDLLPALRHARDDETISDEKLTAATVVAVAIDTGRDLDRILKLKIERLPDSEFAFQPPTKRDPDGWWSWHTIGPLYKSELTVPLSQSESRADQLRFRSAALVRDLMLKYKKRFRIRSANVFPSEKTEIWVKAWIKEIDREQRITLNRLAHLRWNEIHRITGGERACACLILGIPQTPAAVELHYAVLGTGEATRLFEESSCGIWGDECAARSGQMGGSNRDTYSGCRAFPTRDAVKHAVGWLRNGSRHFFRTPPEEFKVRRDRQYLNRAVLYVVWHQFYAFGTRAICDAYQEKVDFAEGSPVGILSDKDFADGYKTRIIWADQALRNHMSAVEIRLAQIAKKLRITRALPKSSVWFLDKKGKAIPITPKNISSLLGAEFPFPVNTPRKIMRNLLRERHVSHEHAEAYMGHWSHGREPWSPYSSFDFDGFLATLRKTIPGCLKELGFKWLPTAEAA